MKGSITVLSPSAIATLLVAIVDNAAPITMAGQGFESLEQGPTRA